MPKQAQPVPDELTEWLAGELETIATRLRNARSVARHQTDDAERWTLGMLSAITDIETSSRRAVHLLTTYGLRSEMTTATPIARACGVTISTVTSRAGSRLASKAWNEIWPELKTRRDSGSGEVDQSDRGAQVR